MLILGIGQLSTSTAKPSAPDPVEVIVSPQITEPTMPDNAVDVPEDQGHFEYQRQCKDGVCTQVAVWVPKIITLDEVKVIADDVAEEVVARTGPVRAALGRIAGAVGKIAGVERRQERRAACEEAGEVGPVRTVLRGVLGVERRQARRAARR
jgi:hypothetical protein